MSTQFKQMTDSYDVAIDVGAVREFQSGRALGAGYELRNPGTWFVYDREGPDSRWHKHCGPYATFEQARQWIRDIRAPIGSGSPGAERMRSRSL